MTVIETCSWVPKCNSDCLDYPRLTPKFLEHHLIAAATKFSKNLSAKNYPSKVYQLAGAICRQINDDSASSCPSRLDFAKLVEYWNLLH